MSLQDLGNLGELIAAVATVLTLAYLAVQLKQNTNALRSQTFQQSSMDMSLTANAISSNEELASILVKTKDSFIKITKWESTKKLRVGMRFY